MAYDMAYLENVGTSMPKMATNHLCIASASASAIALQQRDICPCEREGVTGYLAPIAYRDIL
jgi:hypothetical protein